jgi:glycosyltransferase involved in cell wall biosynthesis
MRAPQHDDLLAPLGPTMSTDARSRAEADRRPVIVASGRFNREKGFRELLHAMAFVTTPAHLVLIGDGHDRAHLEHQASQTTGGHRITFTGWLVADERDRWLDRALLVAVPSMWPEPFGIVGLEGMAAGKPVVAFDVGGIDTWLAHERTGLLVAPGDIVAFARALSGLLADRAHAERLGAAGREVAATRFALDLHVESLLGHYRRVIDASATTR